MRAFWRRADEAFFRRPRRPDFHHLFLCTEGVGHHTIDFERVALAAGSVVHVRPGQVHAFGWNADLDGVLLMFAPEALLAEPSRFRIRLPARLRLEAQDRPWVAEGFRTLLAEYGRTDGTALSERRLQHLLAALVLQLGGLVDRARPAVPAPADQLALFQLFQEEVEGRFLETRAVADYARRLGYSGRTLVRAAASAGGTSPKAVIAARVLLEAKRLLVHTDLAIGRIALYLGFSEATNFTKFFRKGAGTSPEGFRSQEVARRIELC